MLFHSDRSTLPYRAGFPILVANLVRVGMQRSGLSEAWARQTGVLGEVKLSAGGRYTVRGPGVADWEVEADAGGIASGIPAPRVGTYTISEGGSAVARVGASLLSPRETGLAASDEIQFNEQLSVKASEVRLKTDKALWSHLALVAFGVLLIEWWFFHRKPGGYVR